MHPGIATYTPPTHNREPYDTLLSDTMAIDPSVEPMPQQKHRTLSSTRREGRGKEVLPERSQEKRATRWSGRGQMSARVVVRFAASPLGLWPPSV